MNPNTGEVVMDIDAVAEKVKKDFVVVPKELQSDAQEVVESGRSSVDLKSDSRLAAWAAKQRAEQARVAKVRAGNRAKNKLAKVSRRINRGSNRGR